MTIDSENTSTPAAETPATTKGPRKAKKAKSAKNARAAKKPVSKPDRTNKKAEVIAMMKRAGGATLAEIMKTTGWQVQRRPHSAKPHLGFERTRGLRDAVSSNDPMTY
jgi:hypothetical protein